MALDQVRAQFSACMPYRVAAGALEHLLPVDAGIHCGTVRRRTLWNGKAKDAKATIERIRAVMPAF